ncbi:MAG: cell surface protein SprA [Bacteroidetes bacterium GWA2_31_9]|nr:MAG: cell surface protein SprA [Bacteroidetes bacterium GWA2_31_9]
MRGILKYTFSFILSVFLWFAIWDSNAGINPYLYQNPSSKSKEEKNEQYSVNSNQSPDEHSQNNNLTVQHFDKLNAPQFNNLNETSNFNLQTLNFPPDSTISDTSKDLKYPISSEDGYPFSNSNRQSGLYLKDPSNIKTEIEYDPKTNEYIFKEKIGDQNYRNPNSMTLEEYRKYDFDQGVKKYWKQRAASESGQYQFSIIPKLHIGGEVFDRIFGSNTIDIKPQGSAELIFGLQINKIDNPILPEKQRRSTTFDFQEKIQMNVTGQIGDKMKLATNYNTEATFEFENKMNLAYEGKEDEIIRKIEAGNVNLPLTGSLITGSQSLFGIKTELQFGKLTVTSIFSQQKGKTQVIEVQGGAQTNEFEVYGDNYEANKHFFLSHYFYHHYEQALKTLPVINSGINITKVEVWVTNKSGNFEESRNIVALLDLAEKQSDIYSAIPNGYFQQGIGGEYPRNELNTVYDKVTSSTIGDIRNINSVLSSLSNIGSNFNGGKDFEKIENARKLAPSEYTINNKLGYISLNSALNSDEVLAVAYEYTVGGQTYRVGEFSNSGVPAPQTLVLKLIKGTSLTPRLPNWRLMMKNVYAIGAYQIKAEGFEMQVMYQNDKTGKAVNYISDGDINHKILIQVLNLDRLNSQSDPYPDGQFDFIDGYTVTSSNGRIIFPVLEPFGNYLEAKIGNTSIAEKYIFPELYDSTQSTAKQIASKNKFFLQGKYQSSSSSEIPLNALNVPQGSVVVTAGGRQLAENVDYTVDYTLGRVKIINTGLLESGTPIKISLESNSMFSMQSKTLMGTHLDYKVSNNFMLGATILNLTERPLTQKVNIGDEPISNTIWGFDGTYKTDVPFLTKLVDKIPFIETKEMSSIVVNGEFAHLIPGHSRAIDKAGTAYIDDFEGTKTSMDIHSYGGWYMASTPQKQNDLFPEANNIDSISYGFNRAKLAWYAIDPIFLRNNSSTPDHIKNNPDLQSNHFVREVFEKEIFPYKDPPNNIPTNISVLNLAFYPQEKGPYNYDVLPTNYSSGIDASGKLVNPKSRWGGIMRKIETSDFEAANIEYVEFWMMDPFVDDTSHSGGELFLNLGDISEDILKDSKKSFENGFPTSENVVNVDTTIWGRVPKIQSLVNAFDNNEEARPYQDVGFDGLRDEDERTFFSSSGYHAYLDAIGNAFGTGSAAYQSAYNDPSSDNFHYFRGSDFDAQQLSILDRYKKFNLPQGNSPTATQSQNNYQEVGTILPDIEDFNRDNTLNESENYFQYKINIKPENMIVGENFITDKVQYTATFKNNQTSVVSWYQFKVPVAEYEKVVGAISDFKSIRFIRLFVKGFEKEVIMRFATMDLVRGDWRKYKLPLNEAVPVFSNPETEQIGFDISAVNIEENGKRTPVNYVLPPGIDRVIDPTNPALRQLNEQSIVLKVCELSDGDARAAYKNVDLDLRQYKRIQMDVHAEAMEGMPLNNNDVSVFIRLGSDYTNNYYEYEIPLQITPSGWYENGEVDEPDRLIVWPDANRFNIELSKLIEVKNSRNDAMRQDGSTITYTTPFPIFDGNNRITITGSPNLSNIRTIMMGIKNRSKYTNLTKYNDDGLPKCVEVWLNELRMTDFNEKGGWAANARVTTKLADFGTVTIAGNTSKPGFGSIEKKVNERQKEEINQYDISSNFELGKFFPEKAKINIPMYVGFSEGFENPQYYPLDPDVPLKEAIKNAETKGQKDSIRKNSIEYTRRKSINFTNVRVNQVSAKPKVWDAGNIALNYSYSETFSRNISTESNLLKNYRGGLAYNYSTTPKEITPFSKSKLLNGKSLKIIKDFNFSLVPTQISFRTDLNRDYNAIKLRDISNPDNIMPSSYKKNFLWGRYYDFKYNLTKNLKIDFSATNMSRIDETQGRVDKMDNGTDYEDTLTYKHWRESVTKSMKDWGRTTQYHQTLNVNYTLPINKIPLFNWMNISARYTGTYDWLAGPITDDTLKLGNTLKNSNTAQINGQINMLNLYNKIKYLNKLNQNSKKPKNKKEIKTEKVTFEKDGVNLKANTARVISHKLGTEDVKVTAVDSDGKAVAGETEIVNENKIRFTTKQDYSGVKITVNGNKEKKESIFKVVVDNTLLVMMGVKNMSLSYSENDGTLLPGYLPHTKFFGMEHYYPDSAIFKKEIASSYAPGIPFILGWQDRDFARKAAANGWISNDSALNAAYTMTVSKNWNFRSNIEPVKGMRIDLNASHSKTENINEYYIAKNSNDFEALNHTVSGNFSMSVITWGSAFEKKGKKGDYTSKTFEKFKENRITIAKRLASNRADANSSLTDQSLFYEPSLLDDAGFPDGYNRTSQDVMIPAFLAAYTNKSADKVSLSAFPEAIHMQPNWRVTYDGLSKINFLKKYLKTVNISHSYRSTYNVGSYSTNLQWQNQSDGFSYIRDLQDNFIAENEINSISVSEQFGPLFGIDMIWNNSLSTKFEIKKSRNLSLTFSNNQLTDMSTDEYVIGAGYRFKDVKFYIKSGSSNKKEYKSDLNLRADFSVRNNITILRKIEENIDQPTTGQSNITLKLSADYVLSERFNIRLFFDKIMNNPKVPNTYKNSNTNVGVSVKFTLTQ